MISASFSPFVCAPARRAARARAGCFFVVGVSPFSRPRAMVCSKTLNNNLRTMRTTMLTCKHLS